MDNLVYDRTYQDVENALKNTNSAEFQKGAYNYTDLNRVEEWCEYLQNELAKYGFSETLVIKKDWNMRDYPTRTHIDRIRKNIDTLKAFCYALVADEIVYNDTLNYEQANILEKILSDIDVYMKKICQNINLTYNIGMAIIKNKYITLEAKEV